MIKFYDPSGKSYFGQATITRTTSVNGGLSLTGEVFAGDDVLNGLDYGWWLNFDNEKYVITYKKLSDDTNTIVFDAVQKFFWDFAKVALHSEYNGSHTYDFYLEKLFSGSGYTYNNDATVPAFEKDNWGYKNKLSLFNDIMDQADVEFEVHNNTVHIAKQIGSDLTSFVRKGINLSDLTEEMKISDFATYAKGYGAFNNSEDPSQGRLEVEYRSELADRFGDLEMDPIVDERYTVADNLIAELKKQVDATYTVSMNMNIYDLENAGYPNYESPKVGDWILAIDEALNFKRKIRIIELEEQFDVTGKRIGYTATCGDLSIIDQYTNIQSSLDSRVQSIQRSVDDVAASANGKNSNYYGAKEPVSANEGDLWFDQSNSDPDKWSIKQLANGRWEQLTLNPGEVDAKVSVAKQAADTAVENANGAVAKADKAVEDAGFAKDTANQATKDATEAKAQASEAQADAANALGQASQSVDDAKIAVADANTAKGQAANAAASAAQAINNAADALDKFNNMQIGGRNYLLNSGNFNGTTPWGANDGTTISIKDNAMDVYKATPSSYSGINQVIDLTPDMIGETFIISTIAKRESDSDIQNIRPLIHWLAANGSTIISQNSYFNDKCVLANEYSALWWTGTIPADTTAVKMRIRFLRAGTNTTAYHVLHKNFKFEFGNKATDWSPAPEDVQVQITDINGELSQKVSQTTYNTLAGTVDTISTLAKQNQSTIGTLATKTSVDTVNKTATTAQTLAQQNATELLNKANSTTVDTLTQRVTTAESTLSQTATKAELALTKTDVDKLGDSVASQALDIEATADGLKLKADSSTLSDLTDTVAQNSAQLGLTATKADLALTQNDVNDLDDTVNKQATQLALTATKAELQVAQTNVDNLKKTVTSNTAGMTANANEIKLKADSSTVSSLDGRVTSLSGQLDVQSGLISAKVTANDVTGMLNGYATQTWTQGKLDLTADGLTSQISSVQDGLNEKYTSLEQTLKGVQITANNAVTQSQYTQLAGQFTSLIESTDNKVRKPWFDDGESGTWNNPSTEIVAGPDSNVQKLTGHSKYLKLFGRDNYEGGVGWFSVTPGEVYYFSGYMGSWGTTYAVGVGLKFTTEDGTNSWIKATGFPANSKTPISAITGSITVPAGVFRAQTWVQISGPAGTDLGFAAISGLRISKSASSSQITQLQSDINLRVKTGDLINQINISNEGILIAGQKVHITGQTTIDNAVIKDAMIANLSASKLTAGTIDAGKINVINLNASNITTGTITGANLKIDLNTGEILFTKGAIKSTNGNLNIDIDSGNMAVTNRAGNGFRFEDGKLFLTSNTWIDSFQSKPDYGYISYKPNFLSNVKGMQIAGAEGIAVTTGDYDTFNFLFQYQPDSGAALALHNNTAFLNAREHVRIEGGGMYTEAWQWANVSRAAIVVGGANGGINHDGATTEYGDYNLQEPIDVGSDLFMKGSRITLQGGKDNSTDTNTQIHQLADLNLGNDGKGFISSSAIYNRTYSGGAHVVMTPYGTLGRQTSARKYKIDISNISDITDQAHSFLSVEPKQWFDKAETEGAANGLTTGIKQSEDNQSMNPYYGFIAEDLYSAGLDRVVSYGTDGELEGIQYDRLTVYHHELIRELYQRVNDLEAKIYLMEANK